MHTLYINIYVYAYKVHIHFELFTRFDSQSCYKHYGGYVF